jgi:hypothetical protein
MSLTQFSSKDSPAVALLPFSSAALVAEFDLPFSSPARLLPFIECSAMRH